MAEINRGAESACTCAKARARGRRGKKIDAHGVSKGVQGWPFGENVGFRLGHL